jgi:uncharacterized repeat protein (TIGR03803 family)
MRRQGSSAELRPSLTAVAFVLLVATAWAHPHERVLHQFDHTYGSNPYDGLTPDAAGNLYGTTGGGGSGECNDVGEFGCGTVFELKPEAGGGWKEEVLHNFNNDGKDGIYPYAGLVFDMRGNLYGATNRGGNLSNCGGFGCGVVFELTPKANGGWAEEILHNFDGPAGDGSFPEAALVFDDAGNLYGTTSDGGSGKCTDQFGVGCGIVFELTPRADGSWAEKVLHNFRGSDGSNPYASLIFDAAGNLYGTTSGGGYLDQGTVFELMPQKGGNWTEKVLYKFGTAKGYGAEPWDGSGPYTGVIFDAAGNLYGTTFSGGTGGYGTSFELIPGAGGKWIEKVLHNFTPNGRDGVNPSSGLIADSGGNLYGTTYYGAELLCGDFGCGTVFQLTPAADGSWTETILHDFTRDEGLGGYEPMGGLIIDASGNLYGTTFESPNNNGMVFEIVR